jgi:RNA binding exosome subunit
MASVPFHYLDLRAFCYATEDDQRVARALQLLLPEEFELDRARSAGHHGDRILVLSARVETTDEMRTVVEQLRGLPETERDRLRAERDRRVDEDCSFFVSLDKQAAFGGDVRLGEGITLRGKVETYPASRERALEALAEAEIP